MGVCPQTDLSQMTLGSIFSLSRPPLGSVGFERSSHPIDSTSDRCYARRAVLSQVVKNFTRPRILRFLGYPNVTKVTHPSQHVAHP